MSCTYFTKVCSVATIEAANGCVDEVIQFLGAALTELRGFLREATLPIQLPDHHTL